MKKILIFLLALNTPFLFAANYYFSNERGNDANPGTSPSSPKQTMAALQSLINTASPGDVFYLERGSVWYQVDLDILNISGNSSNYIQITSYGTGNMPVLSGSKIITATPSQSGSVYTYTDSDIPNILLEYQSYGRRYLGSVKINGKRYNPARHPNTDYYRASASSSTSITDNESWSTNQWANGWIGVKMRNWVWSTARITSNTSTVLTTTRHIRRDSAWSPSGTVFYYILNAENAIDRDGDWFWNNGLVKLQWPTTPTSLEVSIKDTIINIANSHYWRIDSIEFRDANFFGVRAYRTDYLKINACKFSGLGQVGVYLYGGVGTYSTGAEVTNSEFEDCRDNSVVSKYTVGNIISGNYVHRNGITDAYFNRARDFSYVDNEGYAINLENNQGGVGIVSRNYIDSTAFGIKTHYNTGGNVHLRENFIRNYGMTERGDGGALYAVSSTESTQKILRRNIIMDARYPIYTIPPDEWGPGDYSDESIHAIYLDQDTYYYKADSNSIENCNIALFTNGGRYRSFKYNKVLYPNLNGLYPSHADAIHHSYSLPLYSHPALSGYDTISHNSMALGDSAAWFYTFWRNSDFYSCPFPQYSYIDYNKYFDYKGVYRDIARGYTNYSTTYSDDISEWAARTFNTGCSGGPYDPGNYSTYNNTAYTAVKLFKNWSASSHQFPLTATYVNESGASPGSSVTVPPFYSALLFATSGTPANDVDIYIDTALAPFLSGQTVVVPPVVATDTIYFSTANTLFKSKLGTACGNSAVEFQTAFVEASDPDTIGYLQFTYYETTVPPFPDYVSGILKPDSVQIAGKNIYFINTPKLDAGGQGTAGNKWPWQINYYMHYFSADSVVYHIRGSDIRSDRTYSVGVLSSSTSSTTRYLKMTIDGRTDSVNAAQNNDNTVTIDDITPVDNSIRIVFRKTTGVSGYLNALFLIESTPSGTNDESQAYARFNNIQLGGVYDSVHVYINHGLPLDEISAYITLDSLTGDTIAIVRSPGEGCALQYIKLEDTISGTRDIYVTIDSLDSYVYMLFREYTPVLTAQGATFFREKVPINIIRAKAIQDKFRLTE
jgi:hypothetical protein